MNLSGFISKSMFPGGLLQISQAQALTHYEPDSRRSTPTQWLWENGIALSSSFWEGDEYCWEQ